MLKACNFTKYKFCHRSFDKSLQKNFWTNIIESASRHLYLVSERYLHLKFKCCVVSTCRDTFWTHSGIPDGTFARIVNLFKLTLLIYFKKSIVDISRARWYLWFVLMQAITLIFFYHWVDKSVLTLFRKQNVRAR